MNTTTKGFLAALTTFFLRRFFPVYCKSLRHVPAGAIRWRRTEIDVNRFGLPQAYTRVSRRRGLSHSRVLISGSRKPLRLMRGTMFLKMCTTS